MTTTTTAATTSAALVATWQTEFQDAATPAAAFALLAAATERFGAGLVFANSFGLEDAVVQHLLLGLPQPPASFMLDTGRLPEATYTLIEAWRQRYSINIKYFSPQAQAVEQLLNEHGVNPFYQSPELRRRCCSVRKLEPLGRALSGRQAWITGLRKAQSPGRGSVEVALLDAAGRVKLSPLAHWSLEQVWAYVREHALPYNALHDQGYPSIGCAPCTRAVAPGEDQRAGRWWWEADHARECGLHQRPAQEGPYAR